MPTDSTVSYVGRDVPDVVLDPGKVYEPSLEHYVERDVPRVALDPGFVVACLTPPPGVGKVEFLRTLQEGGVLPSPPPGICP